MGGASPLLAGTQAQAAELQARLAATLPGYEVRCFIAMRYWKPFTGEAARAVAAFAPDEIVLTPLYPQYSTTTTGSSVKAWRKAYRGAGCTHEVCCFFDAPSLAAAHAHHIRETFERAGRPGNLRLLFSAHGLPEQVIRRGDPYQHQVERTCEAIVRELGGSWDWSVCYQSRVGPMKWIGPSTPEAVAKAASEAKGVLVVPVAFVSEHIETLVELDRDYARLAEEKGCPVYLRAPAVGVQADFIDGLGGHGRGGPVQDGLRTRGERLREGLERLPLSSPRGRRMNYDLVIGLHILSVIAWMAGLLYLPRLYVYHTRAESGSQMDETFKEMERKLYGFIMVPASLVALALGLCLIWIDAHIRGDGLRFLGSPWMSVKLTGVVLMFGYQGFLGKARRAFAAGTNTRSEKFWRMTNEIPFVLAIFMVLAVTTKFGGG